MNNIERMPNIYRRHKKACPNQHKGRAHSKCLCPFQMDRIINGRRKRHSLKTGDYQRALRRAADLDLQDDQPTTKPIDEAVKLFLADMRDNAAGTVRNNRRILGHFVNLNLHSGITTVNRIDVEAIDRYKASRTMPPVSEKIHQRGIAASTWVKELEILRHFLEFCRKRKWIADNPAKEVTAKKPKPSQVVPYTAEEVVQMIAACDRIGRSSYERRRARAMVLLHRFAALRVSDVALFRRSSVIGNKLLIRTTKTGDTVYLEVPDFVIDALNSLPVPRRTEAGNSEYFFWSGNGTTRAAIRDVTRTLSTVFRISGVKGAHAHRFRHTLATELMANGATAEDVATILGNSPAIVLRHYAKWSVKRQERITSLLQTVFGTFLAREKMQAANA